MNSTITVKMFKRKGARKKSRETEKEDSRVERLIKQGLHETSLPAAYSS